MQKKIEGPKYKWQMTNLVIDELQSSHCVLWHQKILTRDDDDAIASQSDDDTEA